MNLLSLFADFLWLAPLVLLLGAGWGGVHFFKQMNSGSKWYSKASGRWFYSDEPPKFYTCWGFWVMTILAIAFFATLISITNEA